MTKFIELDGHQVDERLLDLFYDGATGRRVTDSEWDETVRRLRLAEAADAAGRSLRTAVRTAGSLNLFDGADLTSSSEYSSRQGTKIDTLQIHHATTTSFSGLKSLMDPGGRTVSANGAMSNTGLLHEVVPLANRAFTSATGYDRRCLTVEVCNSTLGPSWGISGACLERLAQLAAAMWKAGILGSLTRQHIIGHREVPGTYATACPGPSMDLDWIVARARAIAGVGANVDPAGPTPVPVPKPGVDYAYGLTKAAQKAVQGALKLLGMYGGDVDGVFGWMSVSAFQLWLKDNGLLPADYEIDGVPGPIYGEALHDLADLHGYTGTHAGLPGAGVSAALERWAATITPAAIHKEKTMLLIRNSKSGLVGVVAPRYWAHVPTANTLQAFKDALAPTDKGYNLTDADFWAIVKTLGIPVEEVREGNLWSVDEARQAQLLDVIGKIAVKLSPEDLDAIVAELDEANSDGVTLAQDVIADIAAATRAKIIAPE